MSACRPTLKSLLGVKLQVPSPLAVAVPNKVTPSYTLTVAPASAPAPVSLGLTAVVMRSPKVPLSLAPSSTGVLKLAARMSTVTALLAEKILKLPAKSYWRAV